MLAILLTVSSISAGVIASVSVKFLFCEVLLGLFFRGVQFLFDFVSQFLLNLLPGEPACGRYLHLGLLYIYLPWSRYCDWQYIDINNVRRFIWYLYRDNVLLGGTVS